VGVRTLVTIVTPARNAAATIEATLRSVAEQLGVAVEHVVVDGDSTDETAAIARSFGARVLSGPDCGIYDAMNKGIETARGEWLLFLGADDRLADPAAVRTLLDAAGGDALLAYGDALYDDDFRYRSRMDRTLLFHNSVHHQASLYRRRLFDDFRYRIDIAAVADYELNLRLYLARAAVTYVPRIISLCGTGGASSSRHRWRNNVDLHSVRAPHVSQLWNAYASAVMLTRSAARIALDRATDGFRYVRDSWSSRRSS
jgi:putative colanic acid biosynthesis glycosyltransferase